MNLHIINVIIGREYMTRVKKKSFLLTTFLGPVFFAAMCILPSVIMFMTKDKGKEVAVVDQSGIVMPYMVSDETTKYTDYTGMPVDSVKAKCGEEGLDALVVVSPLDSVNKTVSVEAYSGKPISVDMKEAIGRHVNEAVEEYRLESYKIQGLKQIIEDVKSDVTVSTFTLDDSGEEKITEDHIIGSVYDHIPGALYHNIHVHSDVLRHGDAECHRGEVKPRGRGAGVFRQGY